MNKTISIIIPALNEADTIGRLIDSLLGSYPGADIVVADGGSTDGTLALIDGRVRIVEAPRGRAGQMNAGARAATGDIYWFLHADCIPPEHALKTIADTFARDGSVVGGGFRWGLYGLKWYYPLTTWLAAVKNRLKNTLYGDMGIFIRADVFDEMGGYADMPFLEDMDMCDRLKRRGIIVVLNEIMYSSDRRLLKKGPLKTFVINDIIKLGYRLGMSPEFLIKLY